MSRAEESFERALLLLESDGLKIEDCLAMFSAPEARQLRPLLETILVVREQSRAIPEPANKETNKTAFLAELAAASSLTPATLSVGDRLRALYGTKRRSRPARALAAAVAAVVLTGGVAGAAGSSGPADLLYPLKRAVEAADTVLPRSDYALAQRHLDLAETRLMELAAVGKSDRAAVQGLIDDFNYELDEGEALAKALSPVDRQNLAKRRDGLRRRFDLWLAGQGGAGSAKQDKAPQSWPGDGERLDPVDADGDGDDGGFQEPENEPEDGGGLETNRHQADDEGVPGDLSREQQREDEDSSESRRLEEEKPDDDRESAQE